MPYWVVSWYQVWSLCVKKVLKYEPIFTWFPVWPWYFTFDLKIKVNKNMSIKFLSFVLTSYQIWSRLIKWFRNNLELKFFKVKVLSAGQLFVKWSHEPKRIKSIKYIGFSKKKPNIFHRNGQKHRVTKFFCDPNTKKTYPAFIGPAKESKCTGQLVSKHKIITDQFWNLLSKALIKISSKFQVYLFFLNWKFIRIRMFVFQRS